MTGLTLSRRNILQGAGVAAVGATALPGASFAMSEIDQARAMVGTRFAVSDGEQIGAVVLEEIVALPERDRTPMELIARKPFVAVFREIGSSALGDATYTFSADGLTGEALLVSRAYSDDGQNRLEAVFN